MKVFVIGFQGIVAYANDCVVTFSKDYGSIPLGLDCNVLFDILLF